MSAGCLCCGSTLRKSIGSKNNFEIAMCAGCKTLYAVGKESAAYDYTDYYSEVNLTVSDFLQTRMTEIVAGFDVYRQTNKILDVGCGAGAMLAAAAAANWQAEGTEVSGSSVTSARKKGLTVFEGDLTDAQYPADSFDVVTAVEVLEHLDEPRRLLAEVNRILRSGGLFWATTPHGRGVSGRVLGSDWSCVAPPEHICLFSIKGARLMLEQTGFSRVIIQTHGTNPFEFYNHFKRSKSAKNVVDNQKRENNRSFDRVQTSYQLNQVMSESSWRRKIKNLLNATLNAARLGDSLKIWAIK